MTDSPASLRIWSAEPLPADVAKSAERLRQAEDVRHVVLLPDVHLAKEVCVGAVIATSRLIYPAAVGGDIGCGMAAVAVNAAADLIGDDRSAAWLLAALYRLVPSNRHPARQDLPASLAELALSDAPLEKEANRDGRVQLGTLGRGNHFLEFQADEDQRLWVLVHSGSRGMGQAITAHHTRGAQRTSGLACLDAETDAGRAYLADVAWARTYAAENRLAMLRAVESILQDRFATAIDWTTRIHSDHDHVRRESHFGEEFWIHRKGAQPAPAGEAGIIPGSMGTPTFHVAGRGCAESLMSCSHGAGRQLSRHAARRSISVRQLERQLRSIRYDHRRSLALCEEAPEAYKKIESVLRAQKELVKITRRLQPLLSYKER
jgi:tRNA-splicing ligase RtcB (3'-phosphate/5'-hydroxy nucleic acid ligase)